jgi:hypothetical protein
MTAHSLLYFHHHGSSTSLSTSTRTPLGTTSSSPDRRRTGSHVRFLLLNHILHIEYVYLCRHDFVAR